MQLALRFLSLFGLASVALVASAQTSFFSGNPDVGHGLASAQNSLHIRDARVYEDFLDLLIADIARL